MWEDPIVAEVHRIREKLAAEYNFDADRFVQLHATRFAFYLPLRS